MNGAYLSARRASACAAAVLVGGLLTASVSASVIHVWPGDSIEEAITAAKDGDTIIVHPGEYCEGSMKLQGKAITVRSEDPADPLVVLTTAITPPEHQPVFRCVNGEGPDTVISGFTLYSAIMPEDGGAMVIDNSSPTVSYCSFDFNLCYESGAAMRINGGAPRIANCAFSLNWAEESGGALWLNESDAIITDCSFFANHSGYDPYEYYYSGGAIFALSCDITIADCLFSGNSADPLGGAVQLVFGSANITNCRFIGNSADSWGGGVYYWGEESLTVSGCEFMGNVAGEDAGGLAVDLYLSATATITDCTILGNTVWTIGTGGVFIAGGSETTVANTQIYGNFSDQIEGEYTDAGGNFISDIAPPPPPAPDPPDPVGACCLPGGLCMVGTEAHCVEAGGAYAGDGTDCETADCPEACPGDIDGDGDVDTADLLALLAAWGACP
jgi:hypothetical protein